jgi:ABC-type nitrate/sulfonate/bicarbonate transport system substrate-binding protein
MASASIRVRLARGSGSGFGVDDISCAACVHLGFFEREGLDVQWVDARGGVAAMTAVLEDRADVAYAGFGPVLKLRAEGRPCRIFVSQARALAQALVVRNEISDLAGCRWAVDGIGALSHHMARLTVRAMGIPEERIHWHAVGPPPERIASLLEGKADASLIRTEEALVLDRDRRDRVRRLLDFDELKRLVPLQPHGVLATTEQHEHDYPDLLRRLARAMIGASRALHETFENFRLCVRAYVQLPLTDEELHLLWRREHDNNGWAIDGELSRSHWDAQLALYRDLNPPLRALAYDEIIAPQFITA